MIKNYDKIIIGAGLYGLYSAVFCMKRGERVLVLEYDSSPFMRATYINQARVHMGYHYPRSYSTAVKSRNYFDRFVEDYGFCIKNDFLKIYAISSKYSWTSDSQFEKFCRYSNIKCERVDAEKYFSPGLCSGAFVTEEYTYDANILLEHLINEFNRLNRDGKSKIMCDSPVVGIKGCGGGESNYIISLKSGEEFTTNFVLNSTYSSINQISRLLNFEPFKIKYELCEIILCEVSENLKSVGLTVMDGPFFSIMPFGKTGLHSLTSVTFTPHIASYNHLPSFECQNRCVSGYCSSVQLGNCNNCKAKPDSAWDYMSNLARKYLSNDIKLTYHSSLFSMKPILQVSEIDDSRPTVLREYSNNPTFITVLSGKINTVYDLDEMLK